MSKTRTVAYDIPAGLKAEIDKFFEVIKRQKEALSEVETRYTEELEALKAKYYPEIEQRKEALRRLELELEKFAKKHMGELFKETDYVDTGLGRLIYQVKEAVKRAKGVLEKLEELGWQEAIIIEKKVNWDEVEKWPDEKLIACGTERVVKEKIIYEIK